MIRRHHGTGWPRRLVAALRVVPWPVLTAAAVGVAAALALVVLGLIDRQQATEATQDLGATSRALDETEDVLQQTDAEKRTLAAQILAECRSGDLDGRICEDAGAATRAPAPADTPAGLSLDQVESIVAAYLADRPPAPRPMSPDEVAAVVGGYLTAHPPTAPPPSSAQLEALTAEAVAMWFAANPPRDGEDGADAPPVTAAEIDAAVERWFAANPPPTPPVCPNGFEPVETGEARGADGTRYARSITCVDPASAMPPPTSDPPPVPTSEPPPPTPDPPARPPG